jgi:hypothetical protein
VETMLDFQTTTMKAVHLKAGMTLLEARQRLLIDRVLVNGPHVTVTTAIGDLPIDSNEEVDVQAVNGQPHFSEVNPELSKA